MLNIKATLLVLALMISSAAAQENPPGDPRLILPTLADCNTTEKVFDDLVNKFGEEPVAIGNGMIQVLKTGELKPGHVAIWYNEGVSFTITITFPEDSMTCIIIPGNQLMFVKPKGIVL